MNYHIYYNKTTGQKVQIIVKATAVATLQEVVCYQELYGENDFFVISTDEFIEQFTKKFPGLPKKERPMLERRGEITQKVRQIETTKLPEEDGVQADADLMRFLDAETYREKIEIFMEMQDKEKLTESMLNNIAVCLDLSIGDDMDGFQFILSELEIRKKYEKERLR